ncbi:MAG: LD-carboxypeptidase [Armatimonadetes bacterium]|nr:LD-carboxypeptidase [Armatimonadota bacterium]
MSSPDLRFKQLTKLKPGDKVAILSPSFAAPGRWPHIYELGLSRLRERFGLEPVAYPATAKLGASKQERSADLISAFENPDIKAVISSLGGDDQVTYVKDLPDEPFQDNPKPYFGYSDNTHFMNHLWLNGIPSFYGGALFTQFAQTPDIDPMTEHYLRLALFEEGEVELTTSERFNDVGISWDAPDNFTQEKSFEANLGWQWDMAADSQGITWGGCLESIDEILRHGVRLPKPEQFEGAVLITETSEEMPDHEYVRRVYRALGERGVLACIRAVLVGRPKAWEFHKQRSVEEKLEYRKCQQETILATVRQYNPDVTVVQNLDFGHTNPQICLPYGSQAKIDGTKRKISVTF